MAENLIISVGNKEQQYQTLFPQIESLLAGENDTIANMANVAYMTMKKISPMKS